ncbi:MAG: DUF6572 domain-containing protein [Gemmatimonadota bacterium]
MMSDATTVDQTTVDELTGKLVLLIKEERPWREPDLMHRQLAAKVKYYVRHIRGPGFTEEHDRKPKDTIVRLVSTHAISDSTRQYLDRVGYELKKHKIDFEYEIEGDSILPDVASAAPPPALDRETGSPGDAPPSDTSVPDRPAVDETPTPPPEPPAAPPETPSEAEPELDADLVVGQAELPGIDPSELPDLPEESVPPASVAAGASGTVGNPAIAELEGEPRKPAVFPEEEFGRFIDIGEVVFESASGKQTVLGASDAPPLTYEEAAALERPSVLRAIGAALTGAILAGLIWPLFAAAVGHGVSPMALAAGFMVGFGVRLQGRGAVYQVVGITGTILGCAIGSALSAATLQAMTDGTGLGGVIGVVSDSGALLQAVMSTYSSLDLIAYGLALYFAFRLSASPKPEKTQG